MSKPAPPSDQRSASRPSGSGEADLWLCFAPLTKAGTGHIVEKACELGVSILVPIQTANTVVDQIDEAQLLAISSQTVEQCGLSGVPELRGMRGLEALLEDWPIDRHIMFCDEDAPVASAHRALSEFVGFDNFGRGGSPGPWAVLTGPKDGFSVSERQMLRAHPCVLPVSLGPRTLRADTAVVAALTIWHSAFGEIT